MGRVLVLTVIFVSIPAVLSAQGRGGMAARAGAVGPGAAAVHSASMGAARAVSHAPSSPGNHLVIARAPNGQVTLRRAIATNGTLTSRGRMIGTVTRRGSLSATRRRNDLSEFSGDSNSVPGLGFDYSHVAGTRPNRLNGRHRRNDNAVLFPFFDGGGYFVPTGSGFADAQGEGQPVQDAEEEDSVPDDRPARIRSVDRLPVLGPPAPQPDVPEYVFVRRDGTVFFAVAYSWEEGSLRYVSTEGLRRSVARDALDLDATQQFNEQRGMTFRSPA